jgi:hypothetical protein
VVKNSISAWLERGTVKKSISAWLERSVVNKVSFSVTVKEYGKKKSVSEGLTDWKG